MDIEQMKTAVIEAEIERLRGAGWDEVGDFVAWAFRGTTQAEWQSEYEEMKALGYFEEGV